MKKIQAVSSAGVLICGLLSVMPVLPAGASSSPLGQDSLAVVKSHKPVAAVAPAVDGFGLTNNNSNTNPTYAFWLTNADQPNEMRFVNESYNAVSNTSSIEAPVGSPTQPSRLGIDTSLGQVGDAPGVSSAMQEVSQSGGGTTPSSALAVWLEDGKLRGCTLALSNAINCTGPIVTQATAQSSPVVSFALTQNLIAWKQPGASGYDIYYETIGASFNLPLSSTGTGTSLGVRANDPVIAASGTVIVFTTANNDTELLDTASAANATPATPQAILPGVLSISLTTVNQAGAGGQVQRYEAAYETADSSGANWVLNDAEIYYNTATQRWGPLAGTTQQLDPPSSTANCLASNASNAQVCINPLPAGQVKLSKDPVSLTNAFVLFSGTFCNQATTSGTGATQSVTCNAGSSGQNLQYVPVSTSNPNAVPTPTPGASGATNFGNLDMEGSNAAWSELDPASPVQPVKSYMSYYWDLNPADNSQAPSQGPQRLSRASRYARRSELAMSNYGMALLDDKNNTQDGAAELMYVDFTQRQKKECPVLTSADIGVANCTLPTPGYEKTASEIVGGIQGPLSMVGTVIGYRAVTPTTGSNTQSFSNLVDASSPNPQPITLDCGDTAGVIGGTCASEVFAPSISGTFTAPTATWIARQGTTYKLRSLANAFGDPSQRADVILTDPTKIHSLQFPITVQVGGTGAPQALYVATSTGSTPADSINLISNLAPNQLPQQLYTSSAGRRITAISSDGFWVAWIERTVNFDGTLGSANAYYAKIGQGANFGCDGSPMTLGQTGNCTVISTRPVAISGRDKINVTDQNLTWSEPDNSGYPQVEAINLLKTPGTTTKMSNSPLGATAPVVGTGGGTLPDLVAWIDYGSDAPYSTGGSEVWQNNIPTNSTSTGGSGGGQQGGTPGQQGPVNPPVWVLDGFGGIHNEGSASVPANPDYPMGSSPNCPSCGFDIARGLVVAADGKSGYYLDGYGGIHSWGQPSSAIPPPLPGSVRGAPVDTANGGVAWRPGWCGTDSNGNPCAPWDIARGIALLPGSDSLPYGPNGYVLDGFGFPHPFGSNGADRTPGACRYCPQNQAGQQPALVVTDCWAPNSQGCHGGPFGLDIARGLVVNPLSFDNGHISGYILDGFGGIHAFYERGYPIPNPTISAYFGFDIAKAIVVPPGMVGQGYVLDGYGGLHPWSSSGQLPPVPTLTDYCGATTANTGQGNQFNGPGCAINGVVQYNWDIMRSITFVDNANGYVVDGYGIFHPVLINLPGLAQTSPPTPPNLQDNWFPGSTDGGPFGYDIVRGAGSGTSGSTGGGSEQGGARNYH